MTDRYEPPSKAMGFVYVLNATGTSYFKIGFCKNMIRINELRTKYDFAIEASFIIQCEDYREIEKMLHDAFAINRAPLRVKFDGYTEWFNLSDGQIKTLTSIRSYEELVNFTRDYLSSHEPVDDCGTLKRQTYYITNLQIQAINEMSFHEQLDKSKIVRTALELYIPKKYFV